MNIANIELFSNKIQTASYIFFKRKIVFSLRWILLFPLMVEIPYYPLSLFYIFQSIAFRNHI